MKHLCKSLLLLLCFLLLLSACGKKDDDHPIPSEDPFQPEENGFWDLNDLVWGEIAFPVDGLYGVPRETLLRTETPVRADGMGISRDQALDLADSFLFRITGGTCPIPFVYDKSTGRFSYACSDPLCPHQNCIWSGSPGVYRGSDELFLVRKDFHRQTCTIYSCNVHGENPRKLYESNGEITDLIEDGEYLYFLERLYDEETWESHSRLVQLQILYKTARVLRSNVTDMLPLGDRVIYTDGTDGRCWLYELESKEKTLFGEDCSLFAYDQGWIYYTSGGALFRASAEDPSVRERVLEKLYWLLTVAEGRLYYVKKEIYAESEEFGPYYRGDVYSCAMDGSGETMVWDMEPYATKGIPVDVCNLHTDGKLLHVEYRTYLDFRNMFYPDFGAFSTERGDLYELFIDLSTGEALPFLGANSTKYKS